MSGSRDIESFIACYQRRETSTKRMMRSLLSGTGADWENIHCDVWVKVLKKYSEPDFVIETGLDSYLNSSIYHAAKEYLGQYLAVDQPVGLDEYADLLADSSQPAIDQVVERLNGSADHSSSSFLRWSATLPYPVYRPVYYRTGSAEFSP